MSLTNGKQQLNGYTNGHVYEPHTAHNVSSSAKSPSVLKRVRKFFRRQSAPGGSAAPPQSPKRPLRSALKYGNAPQGIEVSNSPSSGDVVANRSSRFEFEPLILTRGAASAEHLNVQTSLSEHAFRTDPDSAMLSSSYSHGALETEMEPVSHRVPSYMRLSCTLSGYGVMDYRRERQGSLLRADGDLASPVVSPLPLHQQHPASAPAGPGIGADIINQMGMSIVERRTLKYDPEVQRKFLSETQTPLAKPVARRQIDLLDGAATEHSDCNGTQSAKTPRSVKNLVASFNEQKTPEGPASAPIVGNGDTPSHIGIGSGDRVEGPSQTITATTTTHNEEQGDSAALVNRPPLSTSQPHQDSSLPVKIDLEFLEKQANTEEDKLKQFVEELEEYLKDSNLTEDADGEIRLVKGKASLLMRKKFPFFYGLCKKAKLPQSSETEEPIYVDDVEGYWTLVEIEIGDITDGFERIRLLHKNGWHRTPETKKPMARPRVAPPRPPGSQGVTKKPLGSKNEELDAKRRADAKERIRQARLKMSHQKAASDGGLLDKEPRDETMILI